ncbi:phosphoserine aminotransferase [Geothermobacter ehrlichii]|uniref:Phosphoserine aminotransferase n=1 Tax=Geothermobacter ehrlichii TaxID=213224 RepID=A0A5D3WM86_9BACT|nr:3-phosphoserine/phosphohydroxythreonine transaminase [Geothermobacter ehrlichii]TYO99196.1 phosphoserine aminotransferase [Geothermobacter ehrlichii]
MSQVWNFGAGPAMLPRPVMERIRDEWLDYNGMGVSVIEISHRSKEFQAVLDEAKAFFRQLTGLPDSYRILFIHGGARMQFAALPQNLAGRSPSRKCLYVESGNFSRLAASDARPFADVRVIASSAETNYDRLPEVPAEAIEQDAAYLHLTSNNTVFGTQWREFPEAGGVPLVTDQTSEILSRQLDFSRFGLVYAGLQKNLGPSGMALVIVREDLLGHADERTPLLLNYDRAAADDSLTNTTNTFAVYVVRCVLEWIRDEGGLAEMERRNRKKADRLYRLLDASDFYRPFARPEHRSMMNVVFHLPDDELERRFLQEASAAGLYALKGHRAVGGIRASIYNAMPLQGVEALADFMTDFERRNG